MKKIMCKGFTLVELLVVLTIIGILSSMFTILGREASNIAQANKIVENFQIISAAMNLYYAGNTEACNLAAEDATTGVQPVEATDILTALKAYLKSTTYIEAVASGTAGKFNITVNNGAWWLTYTLPDTSVKVAKILENRALQEGFVSGNDKVAGTEAGRYKATADASDANKLANTAVSVWYQVR